MPPADLLTIQALATAALLGLAVGIEREWSGHASGPEARFAGARTFLMLGLLGGVAGWLLAGGLPLVGAPLLIGAVLLPVAAYVVAARQGGTAVDGTTETAALLVVGLAAVAGGGEMRLASGAAAVTVVVLAEKTRLHGFVQRLGEEEMRAAMHFAVLALVVLPLLPAGTYGPLGGVRPRALWIVVLLFSGLNFAGYVARRAVGPARGYGLAGLLGGLISSTAVTFQFSRKSREEPALAAPLALGVIGACTVVLPRVLLVALVLNPAVAAALAPLLAPPFLVGAVLSLWGVTRRSPLAPAGTAEGRNPLRLSAAIQLALLFQAVLLAVDWIRGAWGTDALMASSAILGLNDVDALTLAMSRLGEEPGRAGVAATAIAVGVLSNSVVKLLLALLLGSGRFRLLAGGGLLAMLLAIAAAVAVLSPA